MSWLRNDDTYDTHPKILGLRTDARRWTWHRVLLYTTRHQTDIVPECIQDVVAKATPAFLHDCVDLGLIDVDKIGVMHVHDWPDYQAGDPAKALRQAKWRAKRNGHVDARVDGAVDARVDTDVDASRAYGARPSRPVPEEQTLAVDVGANDASAETAGENSATIDFDYEHVLPDMPEL